MNGPGSWGVSWIVVTGASRGFGASLCECLANYVTEGSIILGLARSKEGLDITAQKVHAVNPNIKVIIAKLLK